MSLIFSFQFSILLLLVREVTALDILYIVAYGVGDDGEEVGITAQETGTKVIGHAQHVAHHQDLSVYTATGTDTDDGNGQLLGYATCQFCGNLFQYDGKASSLL